MLGVCITDEGWDPEHNLGDCRHCGKTYYYSSEEKFHEHLARCATDKLSADLGKRFGGLSSFSSDGERDELSDSAALDEIKNILGLETQPDITGTSQPQQRPEDTTEPVPPQPQQEPVDMPSATFLAASWQERYIAARQSDLEAKPEPQEAEQNGFEVVVVGRAGAGKGSLINHILDEPTAFVSGCAGNSESARYRLDTAHGPLSIRDIPGYDGSHALPKKEPQRRGLFGWLRRGPRPAPAAAGSTPPSAGCPPPPTADPETGALDVNSFLKHYDLLSTKLGNAGAMLYVIDGRATPPAAELINQFTRACKPVLLVFTKSEEVQDMEEDRKAGRMTDEDFKEYCERVLEKTIRSSMTCQTTQTQVDDLESLLHRTPRFFVVTKLPSTDILDSDNPRVAACCKDRLRTKLTANRTTLDMPALIEVLQHDLVPRLRLLRHVDSEVDEVLKPLRTEVSMGSVLCQAGINLAAAFAGGVAGGLLGAFAGSILAAKVVFTSAALTTLLSMADAVGLLPESGDWKQRLGQELKAAFFRGPKFALPVAGDSALREKLAHILLPMFGIAARGPIDDLVHCAVTAGGVLASLPVVGPVLRAATLKRTRRKLAEVVRVMAIQLHRRWIMETMPLLHAVPCFAAQEQTQPQPQPQAPPQQAAEGDRSQGPSTSE